MTAEEARNILNNAWVRINFKNFKNLADAITIAEMALEKQMPKKPVKCGMIKDCCAECKSIDIIDSEWGTRYNFCPDCGQAIDWSDRNDT